MSHSPSAARGADPYANLAPEDRDLELAALLKPPTAWASLTPGQLDSATGVLREQTRRAGKVRSDGVGNCLGVANAVRVGLIAKGVPPDAVGVRVVQYDGMKGKTQQHALVDVQYIDGQGRNRTLTLDMNSPWPLTPKEEAAWYKPLPPGQDPYSLLNKPGG